MCKRPEQGFWCSPNRSLESFSLYVPRPINRKALCLWPKLSATNIILDYLKNRKQRTRVGTKYSDWCGIDTGVPQGSILGPLLFNTYICDLFYFLSDKKAVNYADDTTPYAVDNTWGEVKEKLISSTEIIFTWLPNNQMVGNANKCQLITNQKNNLLSLKIGNDRLVNRETVKVLGITFDNHLTFKTHVRQLCKIANQKVGTLNRLSPFLSTTKNGYS